MVKQFTINLNKGEGELVLKRKKQERRSFLVLFLMVLIFIVLGGLTWAQNEAVNREIKNRQEKLERIKYELDSLKREGTNVSKDDVMALAKLEQERFLWAKRLEALSDLLPEGMALTGLEYEQNRLEIRCVAKVDEAQKEFDMISNFIELLKSSPSFRSGMYDIKFNSSVRKIVEEEDVLLFSVHCLTRNPEERRSSRRG
jgi:Tfp pilus assembly protein PilN